MELFQGRRTLDGMWVAYAAASEIEHCAATHEVVELVTPTGNVARVQIARAGRRFVFAGEPIAYGYPLAIATTEENDQ